MEFFHGYTYSGHPMAVSTAHVMQEESIFERVRALEPVLEEAMHSLKGEAEKMADNLREAIQASR